MIKESDYVIFGAGIYGLYLANSLSKKYPDKKIFVLEYDEKPFQRASYINQARVHNGYHYPRSLSTALKSAGYYTKFNKDFSFAVNSKFKKIYAVSKQFSYASADNFKQFCNAANIPCTEVHSSKYFKDNTTDGCFLTEETSMDSKIICDYLTESINNSKNTEIIYCARLKSVEQKAGKYEMLLENWGKIISPFVINVTYASVNQMLNLFGFEKFDIKYELAEICLCNVSENIKNTGLTVMDGPFFSIMPFGLTGYHSLSTVHFTPHETSYEELPNFKCMKENTNCSPTMLNNCNLCPDRPDTAWNKMAQLSSQYLNNDIKHSYAKSLFAIKPILKTSEVSDSRPTVMKTFSTSPVFISVLSGKFNTIYDLDEVLKW